MSQHRVFVHRLLSFQRSCGVAWWRSSFGVLPCVAVLTGRHYVGTLNARG